MGATETVTAKVPRRLKDRLSRHGVKFSSIIREALEIEADRLDRLELERLAEETGNILREIPLENLVEDIRASRESR